MLEDQTGIQVFIDRQPFGRCEEHINPSVSTTSKDAQKTRYIEAVTDQEYVICVSLPRHRQNEPATWVTCISIHIDDTLVVEKLLSSRDNRELLEYTHAEALGYEYSPPFAFGELYKDTTLRHTEQEDISEISKRGKITVCIQRGLAVACSAAKWTTRLPSLATTDGVLSFRPHGFRPDKRAKKPDQSRFYKSHKKLTSDPNGLGEATTFTFFYISKDILERRGLVPAPRQYQPRFPAAARPPSAIQTSSPRTANEAPLFPIFRPLSNLARDTYTNGCGLDPKPVYSGVNQSRKRPALWKSGKVVDMDGDDEEDFPSGPTKKERL